MFNNSYLAGVGYVMAALVVFDGLVFNIGNIAGISLGLDALFGLDVKIGGSITVIIAITLFLRKRAGLAMDRIVLVLGVLMIGLTTYIAINSNPPIGEAMRQTALPDQIDFFAITTLIGGTVGGYITYAGARRLVDAGISGPNQVATVSRSSIYALLLTGGMRLVLFLAVFGVVVGGVALIGGNPTAEAFQHAAGEIGLRLFGLILWSASEHSSGAWECPGPARWVSLSALAARDRIARLVVDVVSRGELLGGIAELWK